MNLYLQTNQSLVEIKEITFKLERDIQKLFENNLALISGLRLVKSEFSIKNRRIDTLAFDPQTKSFVIIEYKRDKNYSVIDQGFAYLSLMLSNKADFIVEYNENTKNALKRGDVDWGQTRVMFVSPSFTENQRMATDFKDLAIELWEIKQFSNGTVSIIPIRKSQSSESIKAVAVNSDTFKEVQKEIHVYTEQELLSQASDSISELYERFKGSIINMVDDIQVIPLKTYIAFKKRTNIVDVEIQKKSLRLTLNLKFGMLDDPKKICRDVSKIGHRGNGDYLIQVESDDDFEYILSLIRQVVRKT